MTADAHRWSRWWLIGFAVAALLAVLAPIPTARAAGSIEFGATPEGYDDGRIAGLDGTEARLGRQLDFVRVFELWDSPFPSGYHDELLARGQKMLLSVRAKRDDGTVVLWRDIADAEPGTPIGDELTAWAQKIAALDTPVWFTFNHEPETIGNLPNGTAPDFIDAWRRVVTEFETQGVTNAEFVWIMTDYAFEVPATDRRYAPSWYPGDDVVDHIGADAYNYWTCRSSDPIAWKSLETIIDPLRQFGLDHPDKGLIVSEWASTEVDGDVGEAKAGWVADAQSLFKRSGWEQFIAISYFDRPDPGHPGCDWPADSTTASLDAVIAMAADAYYGGDTVVNDDPTVSITDPVDGSSVAGTVTLTASADDPDGVAQVEFLNNSTLLGTDTDGSDGWSVDWDTSVLADGQTNITAIATDTIGATASATVTLVVDNVAPAAVALVVKDPGSLSSADATVATRLADDGYTVTVVDDDAADLATADTADLVIVASSVKSSTVGSTFRDTQTPVWIAKPWILDDNGMTGAVSGTDFGSVSTSTYLIADETHSLAAGLAGTVSVTASARSAQYGYPGPDATVIASWDGAPTIFLYEPGTQLADGSTTLGCRLGVSLFQNQPTSFTPQGWALFNSAVAYGTGGCDGTVTNAPPTVSITEPADGSTVGGTVPISATADDPDGIAQVEFLASGASLGVDVDGSDGWTIDWDTTAEPEGASTITATATDTLGATAESTVTVDVDNAGDPTVVVVVGNPSSLNSGDTAVVSRLEAMGNMVVLADDDEVIAATAEGVQLVIIASTVKSSAIGTTFKDTATPVWVAKPWLLDDQGMTGPVAGTDFGSTLAGALEVVDEAHPMVAGFTGLVTITPTDRATQYGVAGPEASVVATAGGNPSIFVYEIGDQLADGTTAGGCRISFSLFQGQPSFFTDDGWSLFEAAVNYGVAGCSG